MKTPDIRNAARDDVTAIEQLVNATGLFPAELVSDLMVPSLNGETTEFWQVLRADGAVMGFTYTVPEMLAGGTWNLTAIAVAPAHQRKGLGRALLLSVEETLRKTGQRLLLIDTSSTEDFDQTRSFYLRNGYEEEARIRDYWAKSDDKVVFRKAL